jgi:hypothetical protein
MSEAMPAPTKTFPEQTGDGDNFINRIGNLVKQENETTVISQYHKNELIALFRDLFVF